MPAGLYSAYSGAVAAQQQLEVIANNVANASTTGFRRDQTRFDTIYGAALAFARAESSTVDETPGTHRMTGSPLHVAIDGPGLFVVQTSDGRELYTRRGDLQLDATGRLVLPNGLVVQGDGGPLVVPPGTTAKFATDGTLMGANGPLGRLRVVEFEEAVLAKAGTSLLSAPEGEAPTDTEGARIAPGFIEGSNVNLPAEMVALIQTTRSFEASMRSIRINDEMTQRLIQAQGN